MKLNSKQLDGILDYLNNGLEHDSEEEAKKWLTSEYKLDKKSSDKVISAWLKMPMKDKMSPQFMLTVNQEKWIKKIMENNMKLAEKVLEIHSVLNFEKALSENIVNEETDLYQAIVDKVDNKPTKDKLVFWKKFSDKLAALFQEVTPSGETKYTKFLKEIRAEFKDMLAESIDDDGTAEDDEAEKTLCEELALLTEEEIKQEMSELANPKAKEIASLKAMNKKQLAKISALKQILVSDMNRYAVARSNKDRKKMLAITKSKKKIESDLNKLRVFKGKIADRLSKLGA